MARGHTGARAKGPLPQCSDTRRSGSISRLTGLAALRPGPRGFLPACYAAEPGMHRPERRGRGVHPAQANDANTGAARLLQTYPTVRVSETGWNRRYPLTVYWPAPAGNMPHADTPMLPAPGRRLKQFFQTTPGRYECCLNTAAASGKLNPALTTFFC